MYWFFLEDDARPELGLTEPTDTTTRTTARTTAPHPGRSTARGRCAARSRPRPGSASRSRSSAGSPTTPRSAAPPQVEGSLTIDGTAVTEGSFTVDLTSLEFTDSPAGLDVASRSRAMEDAGLQTNDFPTTTFELTEPIDLARSPGGRGHHQGGDRRPDAARRHQVGHLQVDAQLIDGEIEIATTDPVEVVLTDYDIKAPVQGPVAEVADSGSFEFVVRLAKG